MQQRRRVDELDERGGLDVRAALMPTGAPRQHHQQRPQALAAARNDVLGDPVHERYGALQAFPNHLIDRAEVSPHQRANLFQGHFTKGRVA